ncbi:hypothetical protein PAPHI01_0675 [Pancytospora philotis]|nr:hypothetical protein PAPHI01_0675 [Pancytospora philotis]
MRVIRQFVTMRILAEAFVSARLSTINIRDALGAEYGDGEYVDPEGPLNILGGHACISNDMIAKQRMFAAPMRHDYSRRSSASAGNAHEDDVRELPADSEAMAYLSEYYRALRSM